MRSESTSTTRCTQDLEQNIQVLTQALQKTAGSIGMAPPFADAPQFFCDHMCGNCHPYMEASKPATEALKARKQMEACIDAVNSRHATELDSPYRVGFQTAFRMMLLGLMDPDLLMAKFQATAGS